VKDIPHGRQRHLLFANRDMLKLLQKTKTWYMDGTFKVVKAPFCQLFSVHGFVKDGDNSKQLPLAFAFMSRRRSSDYIAVSVHN